MRPDDGSWAAGHERCARQTDVDPSFESVTRVYYFNVVLDVVRFVSQLQVNERDDEEVLG